MLTLRNVTKRFGDLTVLEGLGLEVGDGEIVAVIGPSGCGKSTMLNIIAGIAAADGGDVDTGGARLGYVFQEDRLLPWRTVLENIGLVREQSDPEEVRRLIAAVGLSGFESYYPDALSGGMRQRCSIARAYHYDCDVLLMDEPFKSLDYHLRIEMLGVLMAVRKKRRNAVLFTTHEVDDALAIASRLVVLGERPARVLAEFALGDTDEVREPDTPALAAIRRKALSVGVRLSAR